jgi:hypothetical protein
MKYYSEVLSRLFDSERECLEAERKHNQRARRKANLIAEKRAEIKRLEKIADEAYSDYLVASKIIDSLKREIESL